MSLPTLNELLTFSESSNKLSCDLNFRSSPEQSILNIGLDVGSTTIKIIILDELGNIRFSKYQRHFSDPHQCCLSLLEELSPWVSSSLYRLAITGSGGMDMARKLDVSFIQEVLACNLAIARHFPQADIVIELGGEDAKLTYLTGGLEQRMNETCAGGTGAFIDQMASFLGTDALGLDNLAKNFQTIYPIASRCGVFAKTDIVPLLNEGCRKEDIAASIFQAVVSQTISGLAQGRPLQGNIVFLGGPLHFLEFLRKRFEASLPNMKQAIFPENGHFFVALGAAMHSMSVKNANFLLQNAIKILSREKSVANTSHLRPLFKNKEEWQVFKKRHDHKKINILPLSDAHGNAWLGFDCGSTTLKSCLIDSDGNILHTSYQANKGDPLPFAVNILKEIYSQKNQDLIIGGACSTGYGGVMLAKALNLDFDEVETVAHSEAALYFKPDTSFIIDIGGQDIKCLYIENKTIKKISLNEACSAGCGSFIENFANSLSLSLPQFVATALFAENPADLGTRCTVFMNSKVKQAQKDGIGIGGIAAGLSYSVIKNALFKVLKIKNIKELGDKIVAQGGAFLNDALLRALELELNLEVYRPAIAGHMGAFGAALIAKKRAAQINDRKKSTILSYKELLSFQYQTSYARCQLCNNACKLTITNFSTNYIPPDKHYNKTKRKFISGNRCERPISGKVQDLPNLCKWKYKRLFAYYKPLENPSKGIIGIPRALNIFENYPLWFTLFTHLGFRVELSSPSSKKLFFNGFDTIPSQTVCYPAKLSHGHIIDLIQRGIKDIFFPCVSREQKDADFLHGIYNCPIVMGYPELLSSNIEILSTKEINFIHNFLPIDKFSLAQRLHEIPFFKNFSFSQLNDAVLAAFEEMKKYREDLKNMGDWALTELAKQNKPGLILAGHPYHIDPEINHGIDEIINSCGMGVLTEDSIIHHIKDPGTLRVVDQWAYHSRLYRAGAFVATTDNLAVLQLVSFGCGLDAVTSDQLEEIITRNNRLYAQIKIDEGQTLGPARIRIRSLFAAMRDRSTEKTSISGKLERACNNNFDIHYPVFTRDLKNTHTLLVPQMSPMHFQFAQEIFASEGYDAVLLPKVTHQAIEMGLKHVNNDACFPAIVIIGQLLNAIKSGQFDVNKIALVISQTGGGCRATNYVAFLRKALQDAGLGNIPIANFSTSINGPGIKLSEKLMRRLIMAGHYGDALLRMTHRMRPYEKETGYVNKLAQEWSKICAHNIAEGNILRFHKIILKMIKDFDNIPLLTEQRNMQVGIVGEILLKYHPDANNEAVKIIENEGGEAVTTDIMDFFLYSLNDQIFNYQHLAGTKKDAYLAKTAIAFLEFTRLVQRIGFRLSKHFNKPVTFQEMRKMGSKIISLGHHSGEGWLLGAEMVRMLENGVTRILCLQPFGCLPNHIVGKGLIRELKRRYSNATITPIDYDPGVSEVNQINRIKLMMRQK